MPIALAALALALAPMPTPALPDAELEAMRGGLALPGGVDLRLTVHSDMRVDGSTVLRTIFRADEGAPTLQVLVGDGTALAAATGPAVAVTFILAMVLLTVSLMSFMIEVRVSLRAIHVRADLLR